MNKFIINNLIRESIQNDEANIFGKIGSVEAKHLSHYVKTQKAEVLTGNTLFVNAGIHCENKDSLKSWCDSYINSISNTDYILSWCGFAGDQYIIDKYWNNKATFWTFAGLEPFDLNDQDNPWHKHLSGKTMLWIGPLADTARQQSENYSLLWNCDAPEIKVVKSPYQECLTDSQDYCDWQHKFKQMCDQIDKVGHFDFAVLGVGGFSLLLCNYIKQKGKTAIHLGGGNNLILGINTKRGRGAYLKKPWFGAEHWVSPMSHEIPIKKNLVEGGCYW